MQKYIDKIAVFFTPTKRQFFIKGTIGFFPFLAFYWYKVLEAKKTITEEEKSLVVKFYQDLSENKPLMIMFVLSLVLLVVILFCFSYFYIRLIEWIGMSIKRLKK